jgi:hypothetical protein
MHHTTAFSSLKYNNGGGCYQAARKAGRRRSSACSNSNGVSDPDRLAADSTGSDPDRLPDPDRLSIADADPDRLSIADADPDRLPASHNHLRRYGSIAQLSTVPKTGPYLCTG